MIPVYGRPLIILSIIGPPILLTPFNPNKISLFDSSGSKLKPDLLISINDTLIPFDVISPIAFANFSFVILKAFYPLVLILLYSYKLSISFHLQLYWSDVAASWKNYSFVIFYALPLTKLFIF